MSRIFDTDTVIIFGKYKGKTILEIWDEDPNYIEWMVDSFHDDEFSTRLMDLIEEDEVQIHFKKG